MSDVRKQHVRSNTSETLICDGVSVASADEGSSVASAASNASTVSLKEHQSLRMQCVKLKMDLARLISKSQENVLSNRSARAENETLRDENRRLTLENEHLKEKISAVTRGQSAHENPELIEEVKRLKNKIDHRTPLEHMEVAKVINDIHESTTQELNVAAVNAADLEVDLQIMTSERDDWKYEAERFAIELNEMRRQPQNSDAADHMVQRMESEREEWKAIIEQLGAELNEAKRQKEEVVDLMERKEAEMMEAVNQMNHDMNEVVNEKNEEVAKLMRRMTMLKRANAERARLQDTCERSARLQCRGDGSYQHDGHSEQFPGPDVRPAPRYSRTMASSQRCSRGERSITYVT